MQAKIDIQLNYGNHSLIVSTVYPFQHSFKKKYCVCMEDSVQNLLKLTKSIRSPGPSIFQIKVFCVIYYGQTLNLPANSGDSQNEESALSLGRKLFSRFWGRMSWIWFVGRIRWWRTGTNFLLRSSWWQYFLRLITVVSLITVVRWWRSTKIWCVLSRCCVPSRNSHIVLVLRLRWSVDDIILL